MTADRKPLSRIRALQQRLLRWLRGGDGAPTPKKHFELDLAVLDPRIYYSASIVPVEFFADAADGPTTQVDPELTQMMADWIAAENAPILPPTQSSNNNPSSSIGGLSTSSDPTSADSGTTTDDSTVAGGIDSQLNHLEQLIIEMAATEIPTEHGSFVIDDTPTPSSNVTIVNATIDASLESLTATVNSLSPLESATPDVQLLTFTATTGQIVSFGDDAYLVGGLDHLLRVEFVGSLAEVPVFEHTAQAESDPGLYDDDYRRILYDDLWTGIDAVFESGDGTLLKSTYYVDAGISVDQIQLH